MTNSNQLSQLGSEDSDGVTRDTVLQNIKEIMQEVLGGTDFPINRDTTAKDVAGWDSFKMVEIVLGLEERFSIQIDLRDVDRFQCVGDMVEAIIDKLQG